MAEYKPFNIAEYSTLLITVGIASAFAVYFFVLSFLRKGKADPGVNVEPEELQPESKAEVQPVGKKKKLLAEKQRRDLKIPYSHRWLLTTLKGHSGTLLDLDFSSNGKYLASCAEGEPLFWEGSGGQNNQQINNCAKGNKYNRSNQQQNQRNSRQSRRNSAYPSLATPWLLPLQPYCKLAIEAESLYQHLLAYVLSKEELRKWGFPVECPDQPGKVEHISQQPLYINNNQEATSEVVDPCQRVCCRCRSVFTVTTEGEYLADEKCTYHWGKKRTVENGHVHTVYNCCGKLDGSVGCSTSRYHVSSQSGNSDEAFVKTRPKKLNHCKSGYGVYALDCEMCFTLKGLEVTKVTVVGPDGLTIYDSLVLPENPIVDYNTNFSGITAKDLKNVHTTLKDVRAVLLKLFNSKTIVIGHGLDNDLKALGILHDTVVDTSVVFPHYYGIPFRRSLKSLINCYLHKNIQEGNVGHDSAEDARACMELMLWKVVKDRQLCEKRKSV